MHRDRCMQPSRLTLGDCIAWSGGVSAFGERARTKTVGTVWNDSRKVRPGDVFVALTTEKNDGHRYVKAAFAAGAIAAFVKAGASFACAANDRSKCIATKDPLKAVQRVATRYRKALGFLCIGVTGSSGKTTTRSFIASVLRSAYPVGETYTNWNNHIGVPLSILRFTGSEWAGVIEMGANHAGEISVLSKIAQPDIALITNIGYAHIGLFGSLENAASAKFEIVQGLQSQGFLLLNGDDRRIVAKARKLGRDTVYFGVSPRCEVRPRKVSFDIRKGLSFLLDGREFMLPVPGRHFLYSALPAVFLGRRCGVPDDRIARVLAAARPADMRGTVRRKKGVRFIVDCYNANPSSMKNAIDALVEQAPRSKRVAVVGDMMELGRYATRLHRELGRTLAVNGMHTIVAVGDHAQTVADGALKYGMAPGRIMTAPSAADAVPIVRDKVAPGNVVLLKGSRSMHLENVFEKY
ncbi:MAG: UDP-N-acetylmuramoyl-tripeptide--D-alanyl-D-alanine ligase [Chitinispirillaceae bacterium]|nr:UDP-N-acetylmuramoyl-tripeptide--D-alanyl-D-alanine ligase [Chitinispirillaceae bacterium]